MKIYWLTSWNLVVNSQWPTPGDRFDILSPIWARFFHLEWNFCQLPWRESGTEEIPGTLQDEQIRIGPDVKKSYNDIKDFFLSFTNAHIIEAVSVHFGLDDINSFSTQRPFLTKTISTTGPRTSFRGWSILQYKFQSTTHHSWSWKPIFALVILVFMLALIYYYYHK